MLQYEVRILNEKLDTLQTRTKVRKTMTLGVVW